MKHQEPKPNQGTLLVSEPFLADNTFKRSVILLSEHDDSGTLGFILNKPTDVKVHDALEDFPEFDSNLFFGGPVETDSLFYIHTIGLKLSGAREIASGIYWGGSFEQLKLMIAAREIKSNQIRFYAGYSGWDPKQLDHELEEHSWMVSQGSRQFTFYDDPKCLWSQVLKSMGSEYAVLANFPEDPNWN